MKDKKRITALIIINIACMLFLFTANPALADRLTGRDYVRLGTLETLSGKLMVENGEWKLATDNGLYEIHMGPSGYRDSKGFQLKEGNTATASGFVYQKHMAVIQITSMNKTIVLRDSTGRPAWARSKYSRGAGKKN